MTTRPPRRSDQTRPLTQTFHSRAHPSQRLFSEPMTTLDETLEAWALSMTAQACSIRTIEDRIIIVRAFGRHAGVQDWSEVTKRHIVAFLARCDIKPSTKQSYRSYLSCFFSWMVEEDLVAVSPAARLPRVRVRAAEPDPVSTDEIQRLIDSGIRAHTITKVLLYAYEGLRASEIASIDGQHVDWGRGRIWVANAKGNRPVWRPLHSLVWKHLLAEGYPRSGPFFPSHTGGHVTAGSVSDTIGKARRVDLDSVGRTPFTTCMPSGSVHCTTRAVAERFGVDTSTVRRWVASGRLKPSVTTPGGHFRFAPADVEALAAGEAA